MKTFQISNLSFAIAALFCLLSVSSIKANDFGPTDALRKEVARLVQAPELTKYGIEGSKAIINFTLNQDNEMVVLNVIADNTYIEDFIHQRLNNVKVKTKGLDQFMSYNISILFRSEK